MTEKEMRLKRIDDINEKLKKKYKHTEITGTLLFILETGTVFRIDSIGKFNAIVIESAKKGIFGEDGELFYMNDMNEDEMYEAMIEEIEG